MEFTCLEDLVELLNFSMIEYDYINIQSQGNSIRFGSLTANNTLYLQEQIHVRSFIHWRLCQGSSTDVNIIEFVTIATESNATDFGDLEHK